MIMKRLFLLAAGLAMLAGCAKQDAVIEQTGDVTEGVTKSNPRLYLTITPLYLGSEIDLKLEVSGTSLPQYFNLSLPIRTPNGGVIVGWDPHYYYPPGTFVPDEYLSFAWSAGSNAHDFIPSFALPSDACLDLANARFNPSSITSSYDVQWQLNGLTGCN